MSTESQGVGGPVVTEYVGVQFNLTTLRWCARVERGERVLLVGQWRTDEEAAMAYDHACELLDMPVVNKTASKAGPVMQGKVKRALKRARMLDKTGAAS